METKPAIRTTEFWLTILGNLAAIVLQVAGVLPAEYAIPAQIAGNAVYALSRGLAKQGIRPAP